MALVLLHFDKKHTPWRWDTVGNDGYCMCVGWYSLSSRSQQHMLSWLMGHSVSSVTKQIQTWNLCHGFCWKSGIRFRELIYFWISIFFGLVKRFWNHDRSNFRNLSWPAVTCAAPKLYIFLQIQSIKMGLVQNDSSCPAKTEFAVKVMLASKAQGLRYNIHNRDKSQQCAHED